MHGDIPPLDGSTRLNVHIYYNAIISQPDEKHDIFTGVVASDAQVTFTTCHC